LKQWEKALEERWDKGDHWYELRPCDYYDKFDNPKIIFPDIAKESRFTLVSDSLYFTNSAYFIPKNDHFLLGVLNSSAIWRYATEKLTVLGDAAKGGRLRFFTQFVQDLPIPTATDAQKKKIAVLSQDCLKRKGKDCTALEDELNAHVNALFGLK
jgi:hypothetical protein